ncbi:MAG: VWA domain-containing protein [Pyrinomonadaceae bacterium]
MKRLIYLSLIIFGLFSIVSAQSGRRVAAQPDPAPKTAEKDDEYSESKPTNLPPVYLTPSMRRKIDQRKNDSNKPKKKSDESTLIADKTNSTENVNDDEDTITVDTDLVNIPVSVFDRNGLYIPNLQKSDFKIFENGKEQEIDYLATSDKPFTVILLIDTSPSTQYKIEEIQEAAIAFTNQLKPQDNVMVIEFDGNVHVLTEITNDRQKIYKAIKRADFGSGTALYDAVDFSLRKRLDKIEGRKAIVLFTDGVDTESRKATFDSTLYMSQESEAMIFPIYYNTFLQNIGIGGGTVMSNPFPFPGTIGGSSQNTGRGTSSEEYVLGKKYLEDLAASTGGRVFRPESTPGGLTTAFEGIAEELRRQYNIGYYPQETGKPGESKKVRVRVNRPNLVIRSRDSYIVGAKQNAAK